MLFRKILFFTWSYVLLCFSCDSIQENPDETTFFCDAEKVSKKGSQLFFENGIMFQNGETQSDQEAFEGRFSAKINQAHPYGMTFVDESAQPGDYYEISVWRKSVDNAGFLVIADENKTLYIQREYPTKTENSGWELINIEASVPPHFKGGKLKIYVWNHGETDAFFDNLTITKKAAKEYPHYKQNSLELSIDSAGIQKLLNKRYQAFLKGILETEKDDWVYGSLIEGNIEMEAKFRLKGDWLDHLQGEKWSFRIKTKKGSTWKGLREFSIQNPKTRDFLNEWVLHEFLEKENVLTTRYDFIPVKLNGKNLGIYAYEEHFEKQLLEHRKRREGPILKFSEDGFWQWIKLLENGDSLYRLLPFFEAADILPFNKKSTYKTPPLFRQFSIALNLMRQFKENLAPTTEIFDLEAMAKYYAITDVTNSYHGFAWHNLRFYFNPITCKLEPIVFDGYTERPQKQLSPDTITGHNEACVSTINDPSKYLLYTLLNDSSFVQLYIDYLNKYSDSKYINSLMTELLPEIEKREKMIQKEYPYYQYDYSFLKSNAVVVSNLLPEYEKQFANCRSIFNYQSTTDSNQYTLCKDRSPVKSIAVKAYLENHEQASQTIKMFNFHCDDILVIGTGINGLMERSSMETILLPGYREGENQMFELISSTQGHNEVYYKSAYSDSIFIAKIFPYAYPSGLSPRQELFGYSQLKSNKYYRIRKDEIIFNSGKTTISKHIVIPPNYQVIIPAGVELNFVDSALFLSESPVHISGTKEAPVNITSSDSSARGFTILQASKKSSFNHVQFENIGALNYRGWALTGAVTFYESDVEINNCAFIKNHSEDALNIIRSRFTINDITFNNIQSDAFDADYCTGDINGIRLVNIGNDGLDFSGSKVSVFNCTIKKIRDKGISVGEASEVNLDKVSIRSTNIAISSKDRSQTNAKQIDIEDCNYGFTVFQKKSEFGPAKLSITELDMKNVVNTYLVDSNSVLLLEEKIIRGNKKVVKELLYN